MGLKKLLSQTAIYGVSTILSKFLNYLLTPYLTYMLVASVYGQISLMYAIIPFLNVIISMGLSTAYFKWAGKASCQTEINGIFTTILKFISILAVSFFVICTIFASPINNMLGYGKSWYVIVVAALVAVDNINMIGLSGLRQEGSAKKYTKINVTSVIINVVCCVVFYSLIPDTRSEAGWVLIANLIASLSSSVLLIGWVKRHIGITSISLLKEMLVFSIPLMVGGLMGISNDFIDKQLMRWMLPEDTALSSLGIYGAIAKIAALIMILRQIFTLGAEPFFLQRYSKEEFQKMNAAVLKYFLIIGILAVLFILLYIDYFLLIIDSEYRVGVDAAAPLLTAHLIMGLVISLSFWYKAAGKSMFVMKITIWGLLAVIIVAMLLIPKIGYMGAAYAQLASAAAMFISSYLYNQKYAKTPYEIGKIIFYSVLAVAIYYLSLALKVCLSEIGYDIIAFVLLVSYASTAALIEYKQLKREKRPL